MAEIRLRQRTNAELELDEVAADLASALPVNLRAEFRRGARRASATLRRTGSLAVGVIDLVVRADEILASLAEQLAIQI